MKKENTLKSKTITTADGTKMTLFNGKLHSWDHAAIQYPKELKKKDEYYLYGLKKTKDEWKEAKRDWEGLPPDKSSSVKSRF
jgi:hypothetical protein